MIKVTLWDENAVAIRRARPQPGNVLFLENVMAKVARHQDGSSFLEAVQHGDKDSKPKVRILGDSEMPVKKLNQRAEQLTSLSGVDASQLAKIVAESEITSASNSVSTSASSTSVSNSVSTKLANTPAPKSPTKQSPTKSPIKYRPLPSTAAPSMPTINTAPITPVLSAAQIPRQMASAYTTSIDDSGIKISSILEVRAYPSEHAKFCVRAHLSCIFPPGEWSIVRVQCTACAQFTQLDHFQQRRQCHHCSATDTCNRWIFVFGLLLDDGECDLPVIVAAEDAEHFLGFSAAEFGSSEDLNGLLQRLITQLELLKNPAQEHLFCLQSYRAVEDESTAIRYRLLQTRMQSK